MSEIRGGIVCGLAKIKHGVLGRFRCAHIVVHQQEFAQLFVVESCWWAHGTIAKSIGHRRGVGIERSSLDVTPTRPKTYAADFMRIRFSARRVRSSAFRCATSGEARDGEIKTAPKEMDWADLA